jgi:hypothetical protein
MHRAVIAFAVDRLVNGKRVSEEVGIFFASAPTSFPFARSTEKWGSARTGFGSRLQSRADKSKYAHVMI